MNSLWRLLSFVAVFSFALAPIVDWAVGDKAASTAGYLVSDGQLSFTESESGRGFDLQDNTLKDSVSGD